MNNFFEGILNADWANNFLLPTLSTALIGILGYIPLSKIIEKIKPIRKIIVNSEQLELFEKALQEFERNNLLDKGRFGKEAVDFYNKSYKSIYGHHSALASYVSDSDIKQIRDVWNSVINCKNGKHRIYTSYLLMEYLTFEEYAEENNITLRDRVF